MSIYGSTYQASYLSENAVERFSLSEDQFIDLQDRIIQCMNEADEYSLMMEDADFVNEGANIEYTKAFKEGVTEFKKAVSACKKANKAGDKTEAKAQIKKMKSAVDKMEKTIKSTDSTVGSAVFGYFANSLVICVQMLIPSIGAFFGQTITASGLKTLITTGTSGGVGSIAKTFLGSALSSFSGVLGFVKSIIILVKTIIQFIDDIKAGEKTENIINLYRNKLLQFVKDFRKKIDKMEQLVNKN